MSVFCGYKLWGNVLCDLAEFIPEDMEDQHKAAIEQIKNGAYEEAAQTILEAYPPMLDQLPDLISPNKLKDCPPEKLRASAVFTLPYLFQKGLVITTNFDRVLESIYQSWRSEPIQIVTPNQQDRLAQLRQNRSLGLFKLHGDIGSDTVSIDDLVFTKKQYEEKYAKGSFLVQELTRWFENHRLLFLGCSLNADRTMEVLKSVTLAQSGIRHYAILGCKKSDISKRLRELNDLGILPIFYDDRDHDAVRVILERLLEETDQNAYKKLRTSSWTVPAETKEERRLLFDSDYFPFTGRNQELGSLEAFCDSDERISWWAVTGPGGMGKSRLVYEFSNQKRKDGWKIERFEARPYKGSSARRIEDLNGWVPEIPRTIVVLDDVQAHMELVRRWLNDAVHHPRSEKLRILLLEREGKDLNSASWLGVGSYNDIPDEWCHDENFLYLEPMTDADLIAIMDGYAAAAGKNLNAELLLKTLERIDPELKRPMYAVAIADARCQGKDPTNWDRKKVLDTLLDRELNFHFNRFQGMTGEKATKTLRSEIKELLARSCIHGFLFLDDVEMKLYPKLDKKMNDVNMNCQEFLEGLGILRTIWFRSFTLDRAGNPIGEPLEERRNAIMVSCPDLIKEHLVLNLTLEGGKRELLFPHGWEQNPGRLFFLRQLLVDYNDRLKNQPDYWKTIFQATPQNTLCARVYGNIMWGYAACYKDDARVAIDRLAQLYDEMKQSPEIATEYANGLVTLTASQAPKERTETIARLDELYRNHPDIPEVAVAYAGGLLKQVADKNLKEHTETVERLDELYRNHADIPEVAVAYAGGLFNWSVDQDLKGRAETAARLDELYRNHPDIPEVAVAYAGGLFNWSVDQDLKGRTETAAQLDELYRNHPNNPEIASAYAQVLLTLTIDQDLKGRTETVARLDMLYQSYPDLEDVAVIYAKCLADLALHQESESKVHSTLARSRTVLERYSKNIHIQLAYAKTWFNLTLQQREDNIPDTVTDVLNFLKSNADIIPEFKKALDKYLSDHPDHAVRYQPLLHL